LAKKKVIDSYTTVKTTFAQEEAAMAVVLAINE